MPEAFRRPSHQAVQAILNALDAPFLERNGIFFGGGTRIVLELDEYRESRDIDFLCASREGYRAIRETVSATSLGAIASDLPALAREVRADQYGIRTWLATAALTIKFEIVREARIGLASMRVPSLPVSCIDHAHAFAEKLLANADRGLDPSTLSRDAIDLAFMMEAWPRDDAAQGAAIARLAYGKEVDEKLAAVIDKLRTDRKYRVACLDGLGIENTKAFAKGLDALARGLA